MSRFTNLESENGRALERADMEDKKIAELEEELRVSTQHHGSRSRIANTPQKLRQQNFT